MQGYQLLHDTLSVQSIQTYKNKTVHNNLNVKGMKEYGRKSLQSGILINLSIYI